MLQKQTKEWIRLDNAAIMFPSSSSNKNPRVFRFTCELREEVEPEALQKALDETLKYNPGFVCTMRSGLFWHYLESSRDVPKVRQEKFTPCFSIYSVNNKRLLFYVSYYRARIHAEFYHALTDGTGAVAFMKMLVTNYLLIVHSGELAGRVPAPDYAATAERLNEDSFGRHYSTGGKVRIRLPKAYKIKGKQTTDYHYNMIEGSSSARELVALAHKYGTTVTGLLCAMYMRAIAEGMTALERRLPVAITVPVNLRNYFPSATLRNFFVTTMVSYSFSEGSGKLEDVARAVTECFRRDMKKEALEESMNSLVGMQRNPALRIAPLPLKDLAMSISKKLNERGESAVLSNVGKVELPEPLAKYINQFSATSSTSDMHLCVLTYNDRLTMTFSSSFQENDVAREFFRQLTAEGIAVTVTTNYNQQ